MLQEIRLVVHRNKSEWDIYLTNISIGATLDVCKFLLQTRQFFKVEYFILADGFRTPILTVSSPSEELPGHRDLTEHYLREYTRENDYKFTKVEI